MNVSPCWYASLNHGINVNDQMLPTYQIKQFRVENFEIMNLRWRSGNMLIYDLLSIKTLNNSILGYNKIKLSTLQKIFPNRVFEYCLIKCHFCLVVHRFEMIWTLYLREFDMSSHRLILTYANGVETKKCPLEYLAALFFWSQTITIKKKKKLKKK